ncbi:MAG: FAD synthase [Candidatus Diapherotrites archaeon]|nr:FAD synthase [Candidatus Diapherotrites archaeon]
MQVGMAFGKFVLLHTGHVRFLEKAKSLVGKLVVVVASDETVEKERGKVFVPAEQRREVIAALKPVDEALVGDPVDKYKVIAEKKPDVIILGPDQDHDEGRLAYELECRGLKPKIVRVEELTEGELHKTSKIIERITSSKE